MMYMPIHYDEPVYRPPAEANAAIIQVTLGCSWNACSFCEMYTSKKFSIRKFSDVQSDINQLARFSGSTRKIFLADGNAFVLSANKLIPILKEINSEFGRVQRISAYALPKDIVTKSKEELFSIRKLGLKLLYIGIETGDNELLQLVNKGETFQSTVEGIQKAHEAGIDTSVMIINGLGGKKYSMQHAIQSAQVINQIKPRFLSTLTLGLPNGTAHYISKFKGKFIALTPREAIQELRHFIQNLELEGTIFRSDHVSNTLGLKGVLSKDKDRMLESIDKALEVIS